MAADQGVWGIEIGQAALKAVKLKYAEAADQMLAIAFDYVPHPKILSQPDAAPEELIPQALEKFLSRNDVTGNLVAISLPGQTALARFIQLPPVEANKIGEIVKYEARQQIPFALEDVIWDYQTLGGGVEESGYLLGAEVGLFAMKREQVQQVLRPFLDAKVEIELVQIAPLALQNFMCYDRMGVRPDKEFEPPEDYNMVLDMGVDNTTLLISNGEKIWIRNVPIGGNHFTRALTKDMKLTFAKAEHLKCNATKSPDPRAVFQALRPVFNDYVSEIQRSIGYFSSVSREAKITRVLGVGNGFQLAGLQKFLQQNLQYEVERVDTFQGLVGDSVLNAPLFQQNILSFVVPYGLALQAIGKTRIRTSLLPREIANARKIRQKKPWAVVTAAVLLFGLAMSAVGYSNVARSVSQKKFEPAETAVENFNQKVSGFKSKYDELTDEFQQLKLQSQRLVGNVETREHWPEVLRAINECLPRDIDDMKEESDLTKRERINIRSVTAEQFSDLSVWFKKLSGTMILMNKEDPQTGPSGAGWVFTLKGTHYHHEEKPTTVDGKTIYRRTKMYLQQTLLKNLGEWTVKQPDAPPNSEPVPLRKLGISHATIISSLSVKVPYNPNQVRRVAPQNPVGKFGRGGNRRLGPNRREPDRTVGGNKQDPDVKMIYKTTFVLQFVWKPTAKDQRSDEQPKAAVPADQQAAGT